MASHSMVHETDHHHPTDRFYVKIAIVLTIITIIEVAIYYVTALRGVLIPALLVLSTLKFVGVVAYFMHLKFDNKLFTWMFVAGLVISISVMLAMAVMFHTSHYYAPVLLPPAQ
jgi:cytochrome c oxidase subunit IV